MHSHLLEVLVDPVDGSPLTLSDGAGNGAAAIGSGQLLGASGNRYEIRDGVARMVPSDGSSVGVDDGATQRSFGRKWDQYDEADRERLAAFQYRWFDDRGGEHNKKVAFSLTFIFPRELRLLLERHGLKIEKMYGDYDGSELNADSPRMIALCRKQ